VATFGQRVLFPHVSNILTRRGFFVFGYSGSPESLVIPDWALGIVTLGTLAGAILLVVALVATLPTPALRGPAVVPLLFGFIALFQTVLYRQFFDRYLLALLPSALLLALLAVPQLRWQPAAALVGVLILAGWSIWWERDYLDRRAALWQAGQALVERGIPPDEIDGGYEWIGWHRGQAILAAAPDLVEPDGIGRNLENYVSDSMNMRRARWAVAYELPQGVPESRVLASVPYGHGQRVVAVQRF